MTFAPIIPSGGLIGWSFLKRTENSQKELLKASPQNNRETVYFRENISSVKSASDLVSDPTFLKISLAAFGLSSDLQNKFFIQKILEEGVSQPDALANRLADKRYQHFSGAFGFGPNEAPLTAHPEFAERLLARDLDQRFLRSVGDQDPDLRMALGLESELATVVRNVQSNRARWFTILGTPPVRQVFETALGLPSGIGSQDIDQQLITFCNRSLRVFGTDQVSDFSQVDLRERLSQKFLLQRSTHISNVTSGASTALTLLSA